MFAELQAVEIKELMPDVYNGIRLFLAVQGQVTARVQHNRYVLNCGDMLLVNRYELHAATGEPGNAVLQLDIPFEYIRQEAQDLQSYSFRLYPGAPDGGAAQALGEIRQILYYMLILQHGQRDGYLLELRANLFRLMHLLLQNFKALPLGPQQPASEADRHTRAVITAIHEQFRKPLTLEQMAKRQFLSTHYLSKLFKEQTGVGFLEYLTKVRLESAVKDLLYTEDSVIQIALRNGLPSAQAFTTHFKKHYGSTPTEFRSSYGKPPAHGVNRFRAIPFQQLCGLSEISKHLGVYEQENARSKPLCEISAATPAAPLCACEKVIRVGSLSRLLRGEVCRQLSMVQEKIGFQYVHFLGIFRDGMEHYENGSRFWGYEYTQIFPFLERLGLCPILCIDLDYLVESGITPEQAADTLETFLLMTGKSFSGAFSENWLYEIGGRLPADVLASYYQSFYRLIRGAPCGGRVGLALRGEQAPEQNSGLLARCVRNGCPPDFITFAADPNPEYQKTDAGPAAERFIRSFFRQRAGALRVTLQECGLGALPLFLMDWNTLVGENLQETASFYRSALVVEALMQFQEEGVSPAFWLNEHISEAFVGANSGILSLYHCLDLKRALFHTLQIFSKLGTHRLFHKDGILATVDDSGRFVILGYHPCYFAPIHSMDFDFVKQLQWDTDVLLTDVPDGDYQIKAFRLAMNFSYAVNDRESIHRLPGINIQHYYNDPDSLDYLSAIAAPQYSLFQEHIGGRCMLHFDLPFNALKLYIIGRS